jgi:hypothetical protein
MGVGVHKRAPVVLAALDFACSAGSSSRAHSAMPAAADMVGAMCSLGRGRCTSSSTSSSSTSSSSSSPHSGISSRQVRAVTAYAGPQAQQQPAQQQLRCSDCVLRSCPGWCVVAKSEELGAVTRPSPDTLLAVTCEWSVPVGCGDLSPA